jgi:hypothetical protein
MYSGATGTMHKKSAPLWPPCTGRNPHQHAERMTSLIGKLLAIPAKTDHEDPPANLIITVPPV